jgi:hypothetical protein
MSAVTRMLAVTPWRLGSVLLKMKKRRRAGPLER